MTKLATIGEAATISGLSAKMIRHYETIGLLAKANRTDGGYRLYNPQQLKVMGVIKQAKKLGFSLNQTHSLVDLWQNPKRASREVKQLAEQHLVEINEKINELEQMKQALQTLSNNCNADDNASCSILDGLANNQN
ncbi:Cu(I)-responsive transcriptional regulator [Paraglaciecola sp. 25GB23A]|uniref:Cu(I)-responsive transcriptional regulator n=1 Tax=Paraglaciecola sp. 25GB23A TaxID=3156068 RepID=UPI0032AFF6E2|tara:strand:+ start:321 stop:728 length:408 start_codon:yes stop_codon:yes gene_type:complete